MPVLTELLDIVKLLREGKEIRKCKIDGKKVEVVSGRMKTEDNLTIVKITCNYKDGGKTYNIEATHPRSDVNNVIKIGDKKMDKADVDMTLIEHLFSTDMKATLEYEKDGEPHEIELYARIRDLV